MDQMIMNGICGILEKNRAMLRIPIRQKAKFEGWLKFELAHYIEQQGYVNVEVETMGQTNKFRTDITFFDKEHIPYGIELKTSNTNWNMLGIHKGGKPVTKNIASIITNHSPGVIYYRLFLGNGQLLSKPSRLMVFKVLSSIPNFFMISRRYFSFNLSSYS